MAIRVAILGFKKIVIPVYDSLAATNINITTRSGFIKNSIWLNCSFSDLFMYMYSMAAAITYDTRVPKAEPRIFIDGIAVNT